ncbi:MAG: FAD-binding oxidoreductase [Nitrosomonadales bacterium]|jgi:FAD/FMN-containing dehydrogenase|nr:FAD-binding oxidoreductase [Nitrosomonadales bacterium]
MVSQSAIEDFRTQLRGVLFVREDAEYNMAREVWNRLVDRHPRLIVRCAGPADVASAVRFAREHQLEVAVRGGGHHFAGHAVCDDGLVIDLSPMKGIRIDPIKHRAYAQPGLTWADFDHETQAWALACTGPIVSMTGLPGFTLGGGIGWLHRKCGLACDNLLSADVVTADGNLLRADADNNPDLLWALRGGGGNYGVVTLMEYQLHPIGPQVLAGLVYFPLDQFAALVDFYRAYIADAPDELIACLFLRRAPPHPAIPEDSQGQPVVAVGFCYCGAIAEGEPWAKRLREFREPLACLIRPIPYAEWQRSLDPRWGNGFYNDWRSHYLNDLTPDCVDIFAQFIERLRSPWSDVKIFHLGGAVSRIPEEATAFGNRKARFAVVVQARWEHSEDTAENLAWACDLLKSLTPFATGGVYSNFIGAEEGDRVPSAYGTVNYQRLREIKTRLDPTNFFRLNANIPPFTPNG